MEQFSTYSCVGDCPDVEKLLHAHLLPVITPAPGNMLISGDCDSHKRDPMLAVAMEITSDPTHNTKVLVICFNKTNFIVLYHHGVVKISVHVMVLVNTLFVFYTD